MKSNIVGVSSDEYVSPLSIALHDALLANGLRCVEDMQLDACTDAGGQRAEVLSALSARWSMKRNTVQV